jgi:polyhydroxybutyrate depolymerase
MKIFLTLLLSATTATLCAAYEDRQTPIRDAIKAKREARVADREDKAAAAKVETVKIMHGGVEREALVQSPAQPAASRPVVIVLHGGTRGANDIFERTGWPQIATRERLLLVAPQGIDNQWNDGRETTVSGTLSKADDVGFLTNLIDILVRNHGADRRAIFVTGVSNGGLMTMRFSCEQASSVSAIAPVIATLPEIMVETCKAAPPMPALFMAGTADPIMTYDGKPGPLAQRRGPSAPMLSMSATLDLWRLRNGCQDKVDAKDLPDISKNDASTVTRIDYRLCKSEAPVVHYKVNGGGHQMPSLKSLQMSSQFAKLLGPQNNDVEGPEEIWHFFAAQRK